MYSTILVAVDLSKDSQKDIDKALAAAKCDTSNSTLVQVVEPVAAAYSMHIYAVNINEIQQEAITMAEKKLKEIAQRLNLDETKVHTLLGAPGLEIRNLATEIGVDAIVIGSHGHSGWKILLGSTAIKLLHGADCDVLTVHVGKE